jgi:hypothetical protein
VSAELEARKAVAGAALAEYQAERTQDDHLVDWLALAVKLANALRGVLDAIDDDAEPGPGRLMRGGWGMSGPARPQGDAL